MKSHQNSPSKEWVQEAPYVSLLAQIGESNLPPGGFATIRRLIAHTHLRPGIAALHVGCSAGFLTRELARRSGCSVHGIDIEEAMVTAARKRAKAEGLESLVSHSHADSRRLPYKDESFDVVLSGGALAFIDDQEAAVSEWIRTSRSGGLIATVEFFYREIPPDRLREEVGRAIGIEVPLYTLDYWKALFDQQTLHLYGEYVGEAEPRGADSVVRYSERLAKNLAGSWCPEARAALTKRLESDIRVFDENMRYLNYALLVYRRGDVNDEPLLYAT